MIVVVEYALYYLGIREPTREKQRKMLPRTLPHVRFYPCRFPYAYIVKSIFHKNNNWINDFIKNIWFFLWVLRQYTLYHKIFVNDGNGWWRYIYFITWMLNINFLLVALILKNFTSSLWTWKLDSFKSSSFSSVELQGLPHHPLP